MRATIVLTTILSASSLALLCGCSSITRGSPVSGTVIQANMDKNDYEVGPTTEGKSSKTSFLLGVVQVIDGDKISVLGLKFFEDQYAFSEKSHPIIPIIAPVNVEDRAYYKALAATPWPAMTGPASTSIVQSECGASLGNSR